MPRPILNGYTLETVIAEKLESVVKRALLNTRMKDFYDMWTLLQEHNIGSDELKSAVDRVFSNRQTPQKFPVAFTKEFYGSQEIQGRWSNFLALMGENPVPLKVVIDDLTQSLGHFFMD